MCVNLFSVEILQKKIYNGKLQSTHSYSSFFKCFRWVRPADCVSYAVVHHYHQSKQTLSSVWLVWALSMLLYFTSDYCILFHCAYFIFNGLSVLSLLQIMLHKCFHMWTCIFISQNNHLQTLSILIWYEIHITPFVSFLFCLE